MNAPASEPVTLDLDLAVDENRIMLSCLVRNTLDVPILFAAYPDDGNRTGSADHDAYVCACSDGETLLISLNAPSPPPLVSYEVGILSLSRRLAPHEAYSFQIHLDLPDVEWNPYEEEPAELGKKNAVVSCIRFETRWFRESDVAWSQDGPEADTFWCQGFPFGDLHGMADLPEPVEIVRHLEGGLRFC